MSELLQFLIAGVKNGAIYALVALGFTVVFASTGAINFAQGEFFMLGGVLGVFFLRLGLPLPAAVLAAVLATAIIGGAFEALAIRPLSAGDPLKIIIVTIGGSVALRQFALHIFGPNEMIIAPFSSGPPIRFAGAAVERQTLWIWGLTLVTVACLAIVYQKTMLGKAMQATSLSHDGARLMGIDTKKMVTVAFVLSAALGAVAGLAVTPLTQTAFDVGAGIGVKGFTAAILGGLGNPLATVCGGIVLGLLESLAAGYFDPLYKDAVALVVLLGVLFVRPSGLAGLMRRGRG
ncbi:MAG: branched-chain amino acid ABC transporter permease [Coriobacteriia bacterium]|nr:branched-chain amino acid ABC transporter permease [Coriobacteriia bacterium]